MPGLTLPFMRQMQLEDSSANSTKALQLEKELKEKNLLIGKLRHEGTITPDMFLDDVFTHSLAHSRHNERASHGSAPSTTAVFHRHERRSTARDKRPVIVPDYPASGLKTVRDAFTPCVHTTMERR